MGLRSSLQVLRSVAEVVSASPAGRSASAYVGRGCAFPHNGGVRGGGRDWRVLLPAGEAVVGSGVRSFGVVDSVQTKIINRNVAKQENQFKEQMMELSLKEGFNLDDFDKIIQAPLDKFSAKLPWNKDREELKNMKMQKKVLDVLSPQQRKQPETIRAGHRQAIADRAACTLEDVNMLLASYRELKAMHGWLSTRRKRKEKIPTSQEEMTLMAADPSGTTLVQFMRVKRGSSGRASFGF